MSELSHVYLHLASIGDSAACDQARIGLRLKLKDMYTQGQIQGYRLFTLGDQDAAEEELLHHMFDYQSITRNRFPFLYASVTPSRTSSSSIDELMHQEGFERFR